MGIFDYHFRIVGISISTSKLEYDYPIHSREEKVSVAGVMGITPATLIKDEELKRVEVKYTSTHTRLLKAKSKELDTDYFKFSEKEFLIDSAKILEVMKIIHPYSIFLFPKTIIWKLVLSKTFEQEFFDDD